MKKLFSYLLILTILLTTVLIAIPLEAAAAAEEVKVLVPTDEYPSVRNGGTYIYDAADVAWLTSGRNGGGKTYTIQNDIEIVRGGGNFSNAIIDGMNTEGRVVTLHMKCGRFNGTVFTGSHFIGWGYDLTIRNLKLDGTINFDGLIDGINADQPHIAPLVMHGIDGHAVLENIVSDVDITVSNWNNIDGEQKIGGVVGKFDSGNSSYPDNSDYLRNVRFTGSITVNNPLWGPIGGISGTTTNGQDGFKFHAVDCHFDGRIEINGDTHGYSVGGLFGELHNSATIENCSSSDTASISVNADYTGTSIAGLVGHNNKSYATQTYTFKNCSNGASVVTTSPDGIAYNSDGTIPQVTYKNNSDVYVTYDEKVNSVHIGGVFGFGESGQTYVFDKCSNSGLIQNGCALETNVGGVVGYVQPTASATFKYCNNSGTIKTCNNKYEGDSGRHCGVGGILGGARGPGSFTAPKGNGQETEAEILAAITNADKTVTITDCRNTGAITGVILLKDVTTFNVGNCYVGGIMGRTYSVPNLTIQRCTNDAPINFGDTMWGWSACSGILGSYMTVGRPVWDGDSYQYGHSNLKYGKLLIEDCHNFSNGVVTNTMTRSAGIIGTAPQLNLNDITLTINRCTNAAVIKGGFVAAGIAGQIASDEFRVNGHPEWSLPKMGSLHITNCVNRGNIYADTITAGNAPGAIGGILARMWGDSYNENVGSTTTTDNGQRTKLYKVANLGKLYVTTAQDGCWAGSIAGYIENLFNIADADAGPQGQIVYVATAVGGSYTAKSCGSDVAETIVKFQNSWIGNALGNARTPPTEDGINNPNNVGTPNCTNNDSTKINTYETAAKQNTGLINSEADFYTALANSNDGAYYLMKDITLTQNKGNATALNGGVFYGNGHTITLNGAKSVFYQLTNAAVYDLVIAGKTTTDSEDSHASPLSNHGAGYETVLMNITSHAEVIHTSKTADGMGYGNVGGLISKIDGAGATVYLENLKFDGKVTVNGYVSGGVGGISGFLMGSNSVIVKNCDSTNATITVNTDISNEHTLKGGVGGIFGGLQGNVIMEECDNSSNVNCTSEVSPPMAGGVVGAISISNEGSGALNTITMRLCTNTGNVKSSTVGGIVGGISTALSADSTIEMVGCTNKGALTAKTVAGGVFGDSTIGSTNLKITIKDRSANGGTVSASAGPAGGIIGVAVKAELENVANTGAVSGTNYVGGILGKTVDATTSNISVKFSVNRGSVSGANYVGGIAGSLAGTVLLDKNSNGGAVSASDTSSATVTAAGIAAYLSNLQSGALIDRCANAGTVTLAKSAASATDTAVTAGGIVGISASAVKVNNAISSGSVKTGGETPTNAIYPISNPTSGTVTTDNVANNIYQADVFGVTLGARDASLYTLSTATTEEAVIEAAEEGSYWFYDASRLNQRIKLTNDGIDDGLYTSAQLTTVNPALTTAQNTVNSDWTNSANWIYQDVANDREASLFSALSNYTSNASYIVYIPEFIIADSENPTPVEIDVLTYDFNVHSYLKVTLSGDFTLENDETPDLDRLDYTVTIGDTEGCVSGATVLELGDKVNALHDSEHHEMISATVLTSTYVAGTYRDKVSFVLYYDGTPK